MERRTVRVRGGSDLAPVDCSIIMLAYNRERLLPATLAALPFQSTRAGTFELVLVDDGSSDRTAEIARAYRPPFPYRYVRRENTNCRAAARNLGVRHARGEVILFLDGDCIAPPAVVAGHLARHLHGGSRAVVGGIRLLAEVAPAGLIAKDPRLVRTLAPGRKPYLPSASVSLPHMLVTAHCSCRRSDLLAAGMFDEAFTGYGGEDLDLGERLGLLGVWLQPAGELAVYHQPHPRSRDQQAEVAAAKRRVRQKHQHPWRILHFLEPGGDAILARSVAGVLRDRCLAQYHAEIVAEGETADEFRRCGFATRSKTELDALSRDVDLVHVHRSAEDGAVAAWPRPGLATVHGGEVERDGTALRSRAMQMKLRYDTLLCGARYPNVESPGEGVVGEYRELPRERLGSALVARSIPRGPLGRGHPNRTEQDPQAGARPG